MSTEDGVAFVSGVNRGIGFGLTLEMVNHICKVRQDIGMKTDPKRRPEWSGTRI